MRGPPAPGAGAVSVARSGDVPAVGEVGEARDAVVPDLPGLERQAAGAAVRAGRVAAVASVGVDEGGRALAVDRACALVEQHGRLLRCGTPAARCGTTPGRGCRSRGPGRPPSPARGWRGPDPAASAPPAGPPVA